MGKVFALSVCLCLAAIAVCVAAERRVVPIKEFNVDINDPPRTRWNHVLSHYNSSVPLLIKYCESEVCVPLYKSVCTLNKRHESVK